MINRDDMLELTRRMTLSRNCFSRIVGAYIDEEGFVEGTFNTHFQKLTSQEQDRNLKIAKAIPFAETNTALKQYTFDDSACGAGSVYQFLRGSLDTDFTNDAIFDVFYEMFGERYVKGNRYAIYFFLGNYDIKLKGSDKKVAAFISCAGGDPTKAYAELKNLIGGQELVASMTLVNPLNSKEDVEGKVEEFCKGLMA